MLGVVAPPRGVAAATSALLFCLLGSAVTPYVSFLPLSLSTADHGVLKENPQTIKGYIMREGGWVERKVRVAHYTQQPKTDCVLFEVIYSSGHTASQPFLPLF